MLFLCTGNYYRSRTAEAVFEARAAAAGLAWQAVSAGIDTDQPQNKGPLSPIAAAYLRGLGVPFDAARGPRQVRAEDFERATLVVAVDREEHKPMMQARFPMWASRITYWQVEDIDRTSPKTALPRLVRHVDRLVQSLATPTRRVSPLANDARVGA